jgi:hypothetical protein
MVQLFAARCSCVSILCVSLASFAAITLRVASQRVLVVVIVVYFVIVSGNFWLYPRMCRMSSSFEGENVSLQFVLQEEIAQVFESISCKIQHFDSIFVVFSDTSGEYLNSILKHGVPLSVLTINDLHIYRMYPKFSGLAACSENCKW